MYKRLLSMVIAVMVAIFAFSGLSMASDVTNAAYETTIQVSNNTTAQTNQPIAWALSSADMINADMVNATLTDLSLRTGLSGTDIVVMPGNGANPWVSMVSAINESSILYQYLYSKNVTGGKIVWFPGAGGMTVANTMVKPGNNFGFYSGNIFIDTNSGADKDIAIYGVGAGFRLYVSDTTNGSIIASNKEALGAVYSATATGISTGEHSISVTLAGGTLSLTIDGVVSSNASTPIQDQPGGWTFCKGAAVNYVQSFSYSQGGAPVSAWAWEYGTTFNDSVGANDGTPSFRTTSAAGLAATVISTAGLYEGTVPTVTAGDGWNMIGGVPVAPSGMFTDGGTGFPLGAEIAAAAAAAGDEPEHWLLIVAFAIAAVVFVGIYAKTHDSRLGRTGSLVLAGISAELALVFFYIVGAIPGLALVPTGLILIFLIFWRRSPAPVD
jgi:hypothetical protein